MSSERTDKIRVPFSKRLLDLIIAIPASLILLPVMAVLAVVIWISDGWPVVFSQERPGLGGKIFRIHKFRTMRDLFGPDGKALPDAQRVSRLGRFLRSFSLDELPELYNILRGEMSLVGPRPLLTAYLPRYSPEQARRHEVLPGLTGWAQIHGRNILSWEERFKHDVWYVDHRSVWLDIKIIYLTAWKVLRREGISQPGQVTMSEFMGSGEAK
jgi:lipopolysaccharide/colanic/teichoic acid biosynthesis glycosyltransferase